MQTSTLKVLFAVAAAAAAGAVHASQTNTAALNPLEPTAYVGQPTSATPTQPGAAYVDQTNPLSPAHQFAKGESQFHGTASGSATPYVDRNNPTDPSYVRR